ncbi:MAG: hypothetical protein IH892_15245 [Planctomycetes bacterium]|nr:hypothetical protein [Planctomycetota bacterium]
MREKQQGKRGFKKRYILLMLLFVGLAAFGVYRRHTHNQLKQRIEALRAEGYPMSPAELDVWYRESFPDDVDNGWHLYTDAFWEYVEWSDQKSKNLPGYSRAIEYGRGETWEPIHVAEARAFLADNKDCLDLLYEAAETGHARAPYDLSQGRSLRLPELDEARQCAKLLRLAGETAVRQGDVATSVLAIKAIFSLADSVDAPGLMWHLARIALERWGLEMIEDLLSVRALSETQIQTLQTMVDRAAVVRRYEQSLIGERAMSLEFFQASARDIEMGMRINENDSLPDFLAGIIILRKLFGLHDQDTLSYINGIQASIEAAALPTHEALSRLSEIEKTQHEKLGRMARSLNLGLSRVHVLFARSMAELRSAGTALAVERYRLANGRLPATLQDLVPTFIASVPVDPFDGQALRYQQLDPGYVVYSVGQDLADNQGEEGKTGKARRGRKEWDETFIVER